MTSCTSCGNEVGAGRFCTNCGHEIEWRTDTAERAPVRPPAKLPPPAPADLPPSPRFPMYADERPLAGPPTASMPPVPPGPTVPVVPPTEPPQPRRSGTWVAWLAVGVVLVLTVALGGWLVTRSSDDDGTTAADSTAGPTKESSPSPKPTEGVVAPDTAPPNQDVNGNPVRYDAENMLDGDPETCWRMPGDGTGEELTVTLPARTQLRSVGMINGYAKTDQGAQGKEVDWYHGNRRVLEVEWVFDDGTTVVQSLDDTTDMQSVDVDVTTRTVVVRLREVSPPGTGPSSRNYTAISELSLVGR